MKKLSTLCLVTAVGLSGASAQSVPDQVRLHDSGQEREFIVATDELASTDAQGRLSILPIKRALNAAAATSEARSLTKLTGKETEIVLYGKGAARNEFTRRILTKRIAVQVTAGTDAKALALSVGAKYDKAFPSSANTHIFSTSQAGDALMVAKVLTSKPSVVSATPLLGRRCQQRFAPNDPLFSSQWHLNNPNKLTNPAGMDINVLKAWDSYRGRGVRIGIVDSGVQTSHPDLKANVDFRYGKDWAGKDTDPTPDSFNSHGTSCAGIAAGVGNNGIGITGVAPSAGIVGLRLGLNNLTDADVAEALFYEPNLIQVKSNSWGEPPFVAPGSLATDALRSAAVSGRAGLGTIFVWSAGNDLIFEDNCNYDGYANSIYTIAVGAVDYYGARTDYSEPGACLIVSAPSGSNGRPEITTTANQFYVKDFTGTSAACPIVAGVVALMLEANPYLGWRDVQEILMRSAQKNSSGDSDWILNKAGLKFNHKFGAGVVNASAAVNLAKSWKNLPPQKTIYITRDRLAVNIPEVSSQGITQEFRIPSSSPVKRVEHATLKIDIDHPLSGDLEITLISPSNTVSKLLLNHDELYDQVATLRIKDVKWTFMTVRNWGESAVGTWKVQIRDTQNNSKVGKLNFAELTVFGS